MRRKKLLLFSLFFFHGLATPAQAADISASSCSRADVQAAINSAVDGDLVLVPSGNCTWSAQVTVTNKGITLEGAGIGVTTITNGLAAGNTLDVQLQSGDPTFNLTNMTIDGNGLDTGGKPIVLLKGGGLNGFRVHGILFDNLFGRAILYGGQGVEASGLIDNNTFNMDAGAGDKSIELTGAGAGSSDPFARGIELGSEKFIFIEDNTFNFPAREDGALDAFSGARYVFRHNTVNNTNVEHHGADSGGFRGIHSFEIYENTFDNSSGNMRALFFRSGSGVVFNNTWTGNYTFPAVANFRSRPQDFPPWGACDGTSPWDENQPGMSGYACLDQIGHVFTENEGGVNDLEPVYFWNNTLNGNPLTSVVVSEVSMENHLQDGRDFFSNTARLGYTPFTYPHPLQGPDPPTNVRTVVK